MLIQRRLLSNVLEALIDAPLVLVEGTHSCGKTTFAAQVGVASLGGGLVFDGGLPSSRTVLLDPGHLAWRGRLLVVDRADADPAYLPALAAWAKDKASRGGRVLLIGNTFPKAIFGDRALPEGPRFRLRPLGLEEVGTELKERLWLRGGYPEALLAGTELGAFSWLSRHIDSLVGGKLKVAGPPARTRALLEALAQAQGRTFHESVAARNFGVSRPTVVRALAALEDHGLLRLLPSLASPRGKRACASPAIYLRDSGILHALLGIESGRMLAASPHREASWRGLVVEEACAALPAGMHASRYLTREGAGLDLVLSREGRPLMSVVARSEAPGKRQLRGAGMAAREIGAMRQVIVLPSATAGGNLGGFEVLSLAGLVRELRGMEAAR